MITTRGDLNFPVGESGDGYNNQYQFGDINQLKSQCPAEIAIFVHGWGNNHFKALVFHISPIKQLILVI